MQQSLPDRRLAWIDGRRNHIDHYLARARMGTGNLQHVKDVNLPVAVEADGLDRRTSHTPSNPDPESDIPHCATINPDVRQRWPVRDHNLTISIAVFA